MTNIEKQFVPYEQSLKIRELGFDEDCIAGYRTDRNNKLTTPTNTSWFSIPTYKEYNHHNKHVLKAPLWCQIFDWFANKYNYNTYIYRSLKGNDRFSFDIIDDKEFKIIHIGSDWEDTREGARIACLDKLIELCQKK